VGGQVGEFVAIGEFDTSSTRTLLEEALNGWQAKVAYEPIARPARTDVLPSRQDILTPDKANAFFAAGQPLAMQADDPDCVALQMADAIFSGRLFDRVRQKAGLSYTIQSELDVADRYPRAEFNIMAICNPQNIDKVERAIAEELKKLICEGISAEELATARNALLQQQTLQRSGDGYLVGVLMDNLTLGRAFDYDSLRDRKRARLTATEVNQAIRRHLAADQLMIVRAGDFKKDATKTPAATGTPAAPAEATARPSAPASSSSSKAMEPGR